MQAHIVGGGFGGLAAAAYLIRNAGVPGPDITIYEAEARPGGGFFLGGNAQSGYNLPGSVFDAEFRCTFDLLADIPSTRDPVGVGQGRVLYLQRPDTRSMTERTSSTATARSCTGRITA